MEINESLIALGHAGLQVRLWDDDIITSANLGRQRFAESETGLYKSVALINRATVGRYKLESRNRKFEKDNLAEYPKKQGQPLPLLVWIMYRRGLALLKFLKK
jgi:hypothetical protein